MSIDVYRYSKKAIKLSLCCHRSERSWEIESSTLVMLHDSNTTFDTIRILQSKADESKYVLHLDNKYVLDPNDLDEKPALQSDICASSYQRYTFEKKNAKTEILIIKTEL